MHTRLYHGFKLGGTCAHASLSLCTGTLMCLPSKVLLIVICRPRKYFLTVELYQIRCAHSSLSWIQAWRDVCTCIPSVCTMGTGSSNCVCRPRKYFLTVELYQIRCAHSSLYHGFKLGGTCAHASPQSVHWNCVWRPLGYV